MYKGQQGAENYAGLIRETFGIPARPYFLGPGRTEGWTVQITQPSGKKEFALPRKSGSARIPEDTGREA